MVPLHLRVVLLFLCFVSVFGTKDSKYSFDLNPKRLTEVVAKRLGKSDFKFNEFDSSDDDFVSVLRHELRHNGVFDGNQDKELNVLVKSAVKGSTQNKIKDKVLNKTTSVTTDSNGDLALVLFGKCSSNSDFGELELNYTINTNVKTATNDMNVKENIALGAVVKIQRVKATDVKHELGFVAGEEMAGIHVIRAVGSSFVSQSISTTDYDRQYTQKSGSQAIVVSLKSEGGNCCGDIKVFASGGSKTSVSETVKGKKTSYTIASFDSSMSVIKIGK